MLEPQVVAETDEFLVINKPPGWVVNDAESVTGLTIQKWLYELPITQFSNYQLQKNFNLRQGIVHRLDKDTSGVMVVAKTEAFLMGLQSQFKQRKTRKTYVALVHGKLEPREGGVALPLGRSKQNRQKFAVRIDGKPAETAWEVQKYFEKKGEILTLTTLFPKTGRTHQLRVHLVHLMHPIVADPIYLSQSKISGDLEWCSRLFLHARELCFEYHGSWQCFGVELPEDLEQALNKLT